MGKIAAEDNVGNQDSMIEEREDMLRLPCILTERERLEYGENIARTVGAMGKKEDERKAAAERFKAELSDLQKCLNTDARILGAGKVERDVPVSIILNYRSGYVRILRQDTGEEVEMRPMTSVERQQGMKF